MHCVDLAESFQTHIYLQNLASIHPRTSPLKFDRGGFQVHRLTHVHVLENYGEFSIPDGCVLPTELEEKVNAMLGLKPAEQQNSKFLSLF